MKKLVAVFAVLLALTQISLVIWFESLGSPLGSVLILFYTLFILFVQSLAYLIASRGLILKSLAVLSVVQLIGVALVYFNVVEIKSVWYWQFGLSLISISLAIISSSLKRKISPLVYYLQYLTLAIIVFCIFALGMNKIATGTITIGFTLICLISAIIHLFWKEKPNQSI